MIINITYTAKKDERFTKSFKPIVFVNGKFHYHTERNKKTMNGALNVAKRVAESVAGYYEKTGNVVNVEVK